MIFGHFGTLIKFVHFCFSKFGKFRQFREIIQVTVHFNQFNFKLTNFQMTTGKVNLTFNRVSTHFTRKTLNFVNSPMINIVARQVPSEAVNSFLKVRNSNTS